MAVRWKVLWEELIEKEVIVIATEMKDNIKDIKMHYFCKRTQSNKYKKQTDELKDGEAIIHVDYPENYKNKQQNETKSAYSLHLHERKQLGYM